MRKQKDNIVAIAREVQAIDFTPIYYFRFIKSVKAGQELVWDKAEKVVRLVENVSPH